MEYVTYWFDTVWPILFLGITSTTSTVNFPPRHSECPLCGDTVCVELQGIHLVYNCASVAHLRHDMEDAVWNLARDPFLKVTGEHLVQKRVYLVRLIQLYGPSSYRMRIDIENSIKHLDVNAQRKEWKNHFSLYTQRQPVIGAPRREDGRPWSKMARR